MTDVGTGRARAPRMPAADRRAQLLEVAGALFSRDGFHHVSMDDIADRAAVSKPVLYRHFPSKLDLYLAVVDHRGQALVHRIDTALAQVRPDSGGRDVVRAIVGAYIEFVEQAGESFTLLFESDVTRDTDVRDRVRHASTQAALAIGRGLRDVAGLTPQHAELLSTALIGMAEVAATSRYRTQEVSVDGAVDLVTALAWRGVAGFVRDHVGDEAADAYDGTS